MSFGLQTESPQGVSEPYRSQTGSTIATTCDRGYDRTCNIAVFAESVHSPRKQERERAITSIILGLRLIEYGGGGAFKLDAPGPRDCGAFDNYVCDGCEYDAEHHCKDSR